MKKSATPSTTKLVLGEYRPDVALTRVEDMPPEDRQAAPEP